MTGTETPEQAPSTPDRRGFSSRWILGDEQRSPARTPQAEPAPAEPATPRSNGPDSLGVARPEPAEPPARDGSGGTIGAVGRWLARSIVSIVVVASLVAAAVAANELLHAREDRDAAQAALAAVEADRDEAQARVAELEAELLDARGAVADAERAVAEAESERDGVELENRALRNMLLDAGLDRGNDAD